jgi:hypothetical protein
MKKYLHFFEIVFFLACLSMGLWAMDLSANCVDIQTVPTGTADKVTDDCLPPQFYITDWPTFRVVVDFPAPNTHLLY